MSQKLKVKLTREEKANQILNNGFVKRLDDQNYEVRSQKNKDIIYSVWYDGIDQGFCNCIDHMNFPDKQCKHILAAKEYRFTLLERIVNDLMGKEE